MSSVCCNFEDIDNETYKFYLGGKNLSVSDDRQENIDTIIKYIIDKIGMDRLLKRTDIRRDLKKKNNDDEIIESFNIIPLIFHPDPDDILPFNLDNGKLDDVDKFVARVVKQSYRKLNDREPVLMFNENIILKYEKNISNNLYAVYENADNIVVGIHGANSKELTLLSAYMLLGKMEFVNMEKKANDMLEFMSKIQKENKQQLIIGGHSLGGYGINRIIGKENKFDDINFVLFNAYQPSPKMKVGHLSTKKFVFNSDPISNNIIKDKNAKYLTVLHRKSILPFTMKHDLLFPHSIDNFT